MPTPAAPQALQTITLAGGCFWCLDAVFRRVRGVGSVECGYTNGHVIAPTYAEVCTGRTGHAEAVRIDYMPECIGLDDLLDIFFTIHDPTTRDRQGNDVGPQYRSAIFTHGPEQAAAVHAYVDDLRKRRLFDAPIVTVIEPENNYSPAEAGHQRYFERNPDQGYCAFVVAPKVGKLRSHFADRLAHDA